MPCFTSHQVDGLSAGLFDAIRLDVTRTARLHRAVSRRSRRGGPRPRREGKSHQTVELKVSLDDKEDEFENVDIKQYALQRQIIRKNLWFLQNRIQNQPLNIKIFGQGE